ncbi:MAG TPA: hypothetical protein VNE58_07300 [Casimicrobiaceae bacterium]|nr:hypothetical protein [Casimicrobiaceae bacterium]
MQRNALLLIACPRSGATALAGALTHAGAHAGRQFVVPASEPAASWQCDRLVALNHRLLAALGLRWDSLVPPPERWRDRAAVRALEGEADAMLADEFGHAPHLLLNDPRLALTAAFWRERLEHGGFDVGAVMLVRRPAEVAASLAKREPFASEKTFAIWLHYLSEGERITRGMPRTLVTYDRLLDAPAAVLAHIVAETRFGLNIERNAREAASSAIRRDLKHFGDDRQTAGASLSSGIDRVVDEGYRQLAALSPGTDPKRTIESLVREAYSALTQAIPPWLSQELATDRVHAERQADALADALAHVATLEASLSQARRAQEARDRDEAQLHERIRALSSIGNAEGRDVRMEEALGQLRSDVNRIADTIADQPEREQALRLELVGAHRDLEDERSTISRLSDALEQERNTAQAQSEQFAIAQEHLKVLIAEVEQTRAAEQAWNQHNATLSHELEEARITLHTMQSERDAMRKERDEAMRQLDRLKSELDSARTDLKILDNDRTALTARAQAVDHAAAALRDELARRASAETSLASERDRLAGEVRNHSDRLGTLERDLSRRLSELTSLAGRHDTMARTLKALERSWLGRKALAVTRR